MYDIIVVGGGPAGMTAALYAQRNGKRALVIEKTGFGGQIKEITHRYSFALGLHTLLIHGFRLVKSFANDLCVSH